MVEQGEVLASKAKTLQVKRVKTEGNLLASAVPVAVERVCPMQASRARLGELIVRAIAIRNCQPYTEWH